MNGRNIASISAEKECSVLAPSEPEFMYHLQNALLLGLKELGCIGEMQYRCAEERLRQQFPQDGIHI